MTPTKTEQLRKLLAEATPGPWNIIGGSSSWVLLDGGIRVRPQEPADPELICFLRNNAALLLELVEAAEKVGHPGFCRRNATDEQCDECDLQDAIRKWNGG